MIQAAVTFYFHPLVSLEVTFSLTGPRGHKGHHVELPGFFPPAMFQTKTKNNPYKYSKLRFFCCWEPVVEIRRNLGWILFNLGSIIVQRSSRGFDNDCFHLFLVPSYIYGTQIRAPVDIIENPSNNGMFAISTWC